jgi:hypothetical protein
MVATALSDLGVGSEPTWDPVPSAVEARDGVGIDWIVATVSGDPPPNTKVRPPSVAPDASCTSEASDVAATIEPVEGFIVETPANELLDALSPPRTASPEPLATTTSRDSGVGSDHDSTPASIDRGPVVMVWT